MKVQVKYRSMSTSLGLVRNGDIIDLPAAEVAKIRVMKPMALEELPELDLPKEAPKKKAPAKRKAKSVKAVKQDK